MTVIIMACDCERPHLTAEVPICVSCRGARTPGPGCCCPCCERLFGEAAAVPSSSDGYDEECLASSLPCCGSGVQHAVCHASKDKVITECAIVGCSAHMQCGGGGDGVQCRDDEPGGMTLSYHELCVAATRNCPCHTLSRSVLGCDSRCLPRRGTPLLDASAESINSRVSLAKLSSYVTSSQSSSSFSSSRLRPNPSTSWSPSHSSFWLVLVILVATSFRIADGCSSRATPKPRSPYSISSSAQAVAAAQAAPAQSPSFPMTTQRPNITFQTYQCPEAYAKWYCLNGATCFSIKIGESILYNCECADGYMGQRCEFKDLDGTYLPRRGVLIETAGIAGGLTVLVIVVIFVTTACVMHRRRMSSPKRFHRLVTTTSSYEGDMSTQELCRRLKAREAMGHASSLHLDPRRLLAVVVSQQPQSYTVFQNPAFVVSEHEHRQICRPYGGYEESPVLPA